MHKLEMANIENREDQPFCVKEIEVLISTLGMAEEYEYERNKDATTFFSFVSRTREEFVQNLLHEKERFNRVFKTSNGSLYFQLTTGESLRVKRVKDIEEFGVQGGEHFKIQPMMDNIFFISSEEEQRTRDLRECPGTTIETRDYGLGVYPLELNIRNFGSRIEFKKTDSGVLLEGTKVEGMEIDTKGNLVGGMHVGHPIIEIIK